MKKAFCFMLIELLLASLSYGQTHEANLRLDHQQFVVGLPIHPTAEGQEHLGPSRVRVFFTRHSFLDSHGSIPLADPNLPWPGEIGWLKIGPTGTPEVFDSTADYVWWSAPVAVDDPRITVAGPNFRNHWLTLAETWDNYEDIADLKSNSWVFSTLHVGEPAASVSVQDWEGCFGISCDGHDFLAWQRDFSGSSTVGTPEPSTLLMALMALPWRFRCR